MNKAMIVCALCGLALLWGEGRANAQKPDKNQKAKDKAMPAAVQAETPVDADPSHATPVAAEPENTMESCKDNKDNDGDGHIDCGDQDCEIFAMCVGASQPVAQQPMVVVRYANEDSLVESGRLCSDGIDNNKNGLIDCYEKSCQRYTYCKRQIYYTPEPENKAPGFFLTVGAGLAVPNFRGSDAEFHSRGYNVDVGFKPDVGVLGQLEMGYMPLKYLGFGVNFMGGASYGTNYRDTVDRDDDVRFKYTAGKVWTHAGALVRVQYPFDRFVPYLGIAGGYTYVYQEWHVYNGREDWDNILDDDDDDLRYTRDKGIEREHHFTFALEPGFDIFVKKRSIAVGLRAWLPIWATSNPSLDNIGLTVNATFTPFWREKPKLKPEYENPSATLQEEEAVKELAEEKVLVEPSGSGTKSAAGEGVVPSDTGASVQTNP